MPHPAPARLLPVAALLILLALPAVARAASPVVIGHGHKPGVAVDAAGTAYIAWYGDEPSVSALQFCRLPRGASTCQGQRQIAAPNTSLSRPFVTVSGSTVRIAQYRYEIPGGVASRVFEFTSTTRGDSFGAAQEIGSIPFDEAVHGPGDTVSAATNAVTAGLMFQNMPRAGGSAGTTNALLSVDHPYNGSVGLIDGTTPLTVFSAGDSQSQFRRYDGSGSLNDAANWTPATSIGYADYPRLAGGPRGLFLLAGTPDRGLGVRRYAGGTFGPPVALTDNGDDAQDHITQDAAGRLHAVFPQGRADGLHLIHATSDDGTAWRAGTVFTQAGGIAIGALRAAIAPDHIGVAAWETGSTGSAEVRVATIGPDAPVDPVPTAAPGTQPRPTLPAAKPKVRLPRRVAKARRIRGGRVRLTIRGRLALPAGVAPAQGCRGSVAATVRRGSRRIARKALPVNGRCRFAGARVLSRKQVKRAKQLRLTLRFGGNGALAGSARTYKVKIPRR